MDKKSKLSKLEIALRKNLKKRKEFQKKIVKKKNYCIFDLRNLYNHNQMRAKKIKYFSIGRPNSH